MRANASGVRPGTQQLALILRQRLEGVADSTARAAATQQLQREFSLTGAQLAEVCDQMEQHARPSARSLQAVASPQPTLNSAGVHSVRRRAVVDGSSPVGEGAAVGPADPPRNISELRTRLATLGPSWDFLQDWMAELDSETHFFSWQKAKYARGILAQDTEQWAYLRERGLYIAEDHFSSSAAVHEAGVAMLLVATIPEGTPYLRMGWAERKVLEEHDLSLADLRRELNCLLCHREEDGWWHFTSPQVAAEICPLEKATIDPTSLLHELDCLREGALGTFCGQLHQLFAATGSAVDGELAGPFAQAIDSLLDGAVAQCQETFSATGRVFNRGGYVCLAELLRSNVPGIVSRVYGRMAQLPSVDLRAFADKLPLLWQEGPILAQMLSTVIDERLESGTIGDTSPEGFMLRLARRQASLVG